MLDIVYTRSVFLVIETLCQMKNKAMKGVGERGGVKTEFRNRV